MMDYVNAFVSMLNGMSPYLLLGFFIAGLMENLPLKACMERAGRAAALSVTRPGAAESIPRKAELG